MATGPAETSGTTEVSGTWNVDPGESTVEFFTKAMWVLPVKGSFRVLSGAGTVDEDGAVTGFLAIDAASVHTGNRRRDDHLRSADFFEAANHPELRFDVSSATVTGPGQATVEGSLKIRDTARPLRVPVTFRRAGEAVEVDAEVSGLDRSEWGLAWAKMGTSVINRLVVHARFVPA